MTFLLSPLPRAGCMQLVEQMRAAGIPEDNHTYSSLINTYSASGQVDKARAVMLDIQVHDARVVMPAMQAHIV